MYLEELLPYLREGGKIRHQDWREGIHAYIEDNYLVYRGAKYMNQIDNFEIVSDKWEKYDAS